MCVASASFSTTVPWCFLITSFIFVAVFLSTSGLTKILGTVIHLFCIKARSAAINMSTVRSIRDPDCNNSDSLISEMFHVNSILTLKTKILILCKDIWKDIKRTLNNYFSTRKIKSPPSLLLLETICSS